jgi:hypothetical protein
MSQHYPDVHDPRKYADGCPLTTKQATHTLALVSTIGVDIFFAVIPWVFVWRLNAPRREKIMIAGSLSLGVL